MGIRMRGCPFIFIHFSLVKKRDLNYNNYTIFD